MTRFALSIAILLLALLTGALGDWTIGVTGDRITVAGNAIQAASTWSPLSLSPVAWWTGDDTAADASGSGFDGTWSGSASYTNGINGRCFLFAGANAVVKSFDAALATTNTTICAWVRVDAGAGKIRTALSMRQSSPNKGYYLSAFSDNNYSFRPAISFSPVGTVVAATIGTWVHVAASYDCTNWRWYVNGSPSGDVLTGSYEPATTSSLMIGALSDGGPRLFFRGAVDDVMIFNRTLTVDEIGQIYEWRE